MKKTFFYAFFLLILTAALLPAQTEENIDDLFDVPEDQIVEEAETVTDPAALVNAKPGVVWGGEFKSALGLYVQWPDFWASREDWLEASDGLSVGLTGKLFFDARPDSDFRVFGKLTTDFPFYTSISIPTDTTQSVAADNPLLTWTLNNIKIFELFSDFNIYQTVFFRFGKQVAGWGLSRFYQLADPLSVAVKDPEEPEEDLEGPLALKMTLPLGLHNLYFYTVAKDSYLPANLLDTTFRDLGYGLKGDFFLPVPQNPIISNVEITAGAYYQSDLAPKFVLGIATGIWKFDFFSDQIFSWGLDHYRLTDETEVAPSSGIVHKTQKAENGLFYAMTAGMMYTNSDWHLTIFGEYLFNGAGSADAGYLEKLYARFQAEQIDNITKTLSFSDLFAYQAQHNTSFALTLSELFGTDKLAASLFWQANWNDFSGLVVPSLTFTVNEYFSLETGARLVYGQDNTEFVLKSMDRSSLTPQRLTLFCELVLGSGKF